MSKWLSLSSLVLTLASAQAAWHQVFVPLESKRDLDRLQAVVGTLDPCGTVFTEAGVELALEDADLVALAPTGLTPQLLEPATSTSIRPVVRGP
jgi:hypothetical protein